MNDLRLLLFTLIGILLILVYYNSENSKELTMSYNKRTSNYIPLQAISLTPNSATLYTQVFIQNKDLGTIKHIQSYNTKRISINNTTKTVNSLQRDTHNLELSKNAYRTLRRRINWLYYLAKKKTIITYRNKLLYNFKINFLTLTLPSKQRTPTNEVNKLLLNQFLTELRQRTPLKNYVWRLEFQSNGNVHYHIVTDTYLDYFLVKKIWNRILKYHGYIKPYQDKFKDLSFEEYNNLTNSDNNQQIETVKKRFETQSAENWSNPPTVNVKSVVNKDSISTYISKYFNKTDDNKPKSNSLDNAENTKNLRLWYCSKSLSRLNTIKYFVEELTIDLIGIISGNRKTKTVEREHTKSFYFSIQNFKSDSKQILDNLFKSHANSIGYIPSG